MAILVSIQPQWSEKILSGEKDIEIRKTKPKGKTKEKVYIYESKGREFPFNVKIDTIANDNNARFLDCRRGMPPIRTRQSKKGEIPYIAYGKMKVVAECVCFFDERSYDFLKHSRADFYSFCKHSGIDYFEESDFIKKYIGGKDRFYAWHISDLKVYDKPKDLSDFKHWKYDKEYGGYFLEKITKPPQDWCFCELLEEKCYE